MEDTIKRASAPSVTITARVTGTTGWPRPNRIQIEPVEVTPAVGVDVWTAVDVPRSMPDPEGLLRTGAVVRFRGTCAQTWTHTSLGRRIVVGRLIRVRDLEVIDAGEGKRGTEKRAMRIVTVARKPLEKGTSVAGNVERHGTGALNLEGCRTPRGSWPANVVVVTAEAAGEVDRQSGYSRSRRGKRGAGAAGDGWGMTHTGTEYDDAGGGSRFFSTVVSTTPGGLEEERVHDGVVRTSRRRSDEHCRSSACPRDTSRPTIPPVVSPPKQLTAAPSSTEEDIAHYLATGRVDTHGWGMYPGGSMFDQMTARKHALREALVARLLELGQGQGLPEAPLEEGRSAFLFAKLDPMVCGLFPRVEQDLVLDLVMGAVVFLDQGTTLTTIRETSWENTAWDIARIWLDSIGAEPLSEGDGGLLGLSEENTCYVSLAYFDDLERDPFSDYVVHEVAHVFHNQKRERVGLPPRRKSEWMLDIEYRDREMFAYACEVYGRILERGRRRDDRLRLVDEFAQNPYEAGGQVDPDRLVDILREAFRARNGWKRILARCAPRPREG